MAIYNQPGIAESPVIVKCYGCKEEHEVYGAKGSGTHSIECTCGLTINWFVY